MKLTERNQLAGTSTSTDLVHLVRGGISYKSALSTVLDNSKIPFRVTDADVEFIIFKKDPDQTTTQVLSDGDFLIYINRTDKRMIIGMAIGSVSSYPTDLTNTLKFLRFYDGNAML